MYQDYVNARSELINVLQSLKKVEDAAAMMNQNWRGKESIGDTLKNDAR